MAFSRALAPTTTLTADELTSAMVGIGMGFAASGPAVEPNIEDTLLFASMEAIDRDDLRVLAVLVTWFGVHHARVNADRLTRLVGQYESRRVRALWSALASWQRRDGRLARLAALHVGPRVDVLPTGTDFQIGRHGEDPRFEGSSLRVPANVLRDRAADVLAPAALAERHHAYRLRIMIGPTYRADLWAELEQAPDISAAELARRVYASFATAWQVKRDFAILRPSGRAGQRRRKGVPSNTRP